MNVNSLEKASINSTLIFDKLEMDKIAVRDNGIMKVERGACVNKKFKYFNNTAE